MKIRGGTNIKKPNFEHSEPQRIELRTHSNISFGPKTELRTSRTSPKTELFGNFIDKKWAQIFLKSSKPNFKHDRTSDFAQKPNFKSFEHHQKLNSLQTSNCSFHPQLFPQGNHTASNHFCYSHITKRASIWLFFLVLLFEGNRF